MDGESSAQSQGHGPESKKRGSFEIEEASEKSPKRVKIRDLGLVFLTLSSSNSRNCTVGGYKSKPNLKYIRETKEAMGEASSSIRPLKFTNKLNKDRVNMLRILRSSQFQKAELEMSHPKKKM